MRGARRVVVLAAALLPALVPDAVARAAEYRLSLDEAIARALAKNEAIVIERESLRAAEAGVEGAQGAYDPLFALDTGWRESSLPVNSAFSGAPEPRLAPTDEWLAAAASLRRLLPTGGVVSLGAAAGRHETDGVFTLLSPAYDSRLGLEVRQPLLQDRAIDPARLRVRLAAEDQRRADATLTSVVNDTVGAVEQAYWGLTAALSAIAVRQEAVRLAEEQLDETAIRIEGGIAPDTEIAQPRAELERRRGELLETIERSARIENRLKLLILGDDEHDLWGGRLVPGDQVAVEPAAVDADAALRRALANRPELMAADALIEQRRAEVDFARDGVRPTLDAVVAYDRYGLAGSSNPQGASVPGLDPSIPPQLEGGLGQSFETLGNGDFDDIRVALVLGIPLGNRAAKADVEVARAAESQAVAGLESLRKTIRVEVLDAAAALATTGQRIEATRAARQAAEVQLAAERERYEVGLSTNFLVLTRQNDLSSARLSEIAAVTDYRSARVEMARATGTLLAERGIELAPAGGATEDGSRAPEK